MKINSDQKEIILISQVELMYIYYSYKFFCQIYK
jgi:hypothetical protein